MRRRKSLIESRDKSQDLGLPWAFRAQAVDRPRLARSRASKVTRFSAIARDKSQEVVAEAPQPPELQREFVARPAGFRTHDPLVRRGQNRIWPITKSIPCSVRQLSL